MIIYSYPLFIAAASILHAFCHWWLANDCVIFSCYVLDRLSLKLDFDSYVVYLLASPCVFLGIFGHILARCVVPSGCSAAYKRV